MENTAPRKIRVGPIIGSLVLLSLVVLIAIKLASEAAPATSDATTSTATQPAAVKPSVADTDRPSSDVVWQFEEANLVVSPQRRATALAQCATPAYIEKNPIIEPRPEAADLTLSVLRDNSKLDWHAGKTPATYYVVSHAVVQTKRGDTIVNTYAAEPHATLWIKTTAGWRANQETTIELR